MEELVYENGLVKCVRCLCGIHANDPDRDYTIGLNAYVCDRCVGEEEECFETQRFRHFKDIEMNEAKWRSAINTLYDMTPKRFSRYAEHSGGGKHIIAKWFNSYLTFEMFNECMEMYMPEVKKVKSDDFNPKYLKYKYKMKLNNKGTRKI